MRILHIATLALAVLHCSIETAQAFEFEKKMMFESMGGNTTMRVVSTTDIELFQSLIEAFQKRNPGLNVEYVQASSNAVFEAVTDPKERFDIAISSAMDLQTKAANDGFTQAYSSPTTAAFPSWSRWRNQVFGFSQEPAVLVASKQAFRNMATPTTRPELIELLRSHQDWFRGKIGTYDVRTSGLGYLFASQDVRQSDGYWRLAEVMGSLEPKLYCCSSAMIKAIESKEILLAYNVLGPYARARIAARDFAFIVPFSDYTNVMMRSALIPAQAKNPVFAGKFIDFLLSSTGRKLLRNEVGLPPLDPKILKTGDALRPIKLGPGLLVYLDRLKREGFLNEWKDSMLQQ